MDNQSLEASKLLYLNDAGQRNESIAQTYEAYLNKPLNSVQQGDVILSAGALGSPQILMLSGVGPKNNLENFGIHLVLDFEGAGQEMKENPRIEASTNTDYQFSNVLQVAGVKEDFIFIPEGAIAPTSFNASTIVIASKIAFPKSKGELELNNTDPREKPYSGIQLS